MSETTDTTDEELHEPFDNYENARDELVSGLREAYAAGFAEALGTFDVDVDFDTSVDALTNNESIIESHHYYWEGRTLPLEPWLLNRFTTDDSRHPESPSYRVGTEITDCGDHGKIVDVHEDHDHDVYEVEYEDGGTNELTATELRRGLADGTIVVIG